MFLCKKTKKQTYKIFLDELALLFVSTYSEEPHGDGIDHPEGIYPSLPPDGKLQ